jgi:hypothetical protein
MEADMPPKKTAHQDTVADEQAAAAPRRRLFAANALRVLIINAIFGVLIGVSVFAASERTALFALMGFSGAGGISGAGHSAQEKGPATVKAVSLVGAASFAPDDPVLRFAETRTGQMLFTAGGSDNCQRVLFNNQNGASFDVPGVFCGQPASQVEDAATPNRLQAMRAAFKK